MTLKNRQNFINPYFLHHIGEEMMQQIKIQKRRRGRPRKHRYAIRHIHILLDEKIARQLDEFCEQHLTTKQEVIFNLIIQFLHNKSKLGNLLSKKTGRSRYKQFVELVLNSALLTIANQYEKVLKNPILRLRREALLELLDRAGLVPHTDTLRRYVIKMESEGIAVNKLPHGIILIASLDKFREYLSNTEMQHELQRNLDKVEAWEKRLTQKLLTENY